VAAQSEVSFGHGAGTAHRHEADDDIYYGLALMRSKMAWPRLQPCSV